MASACLWFQKIGLRDIVHDLFCMLHQHHGMIYVMIVCRMPTVVVFKGNLKINLFQLLLFPSHTTSISLVRKTILLYVCVTQRFELLRRKVLYKYLLSFRVKTSLRLASHELFCLILMSFEWYIVTWKVLMTVTCSQEERKLRYCHGKRYWK